MAFYFALQAYNSCHFFPLQVFEVNIPDPELIQAVCDKIINHEHNLILVIAQKEFSVRAALVPEGFLFKFRMYGYPKEKTKRHLLRFFIILSNN